jgi:hypothetical protein
MSGQGIEGDCGKRWRRQGWQRAKEVFDQALKVAEGIEEAWKRAGALSAIAEGMAKAGMTDWAKEVFDQALKWRKGLRKAWERAWALRRYCGRDGEGRDV